MRSALSLWVIGGAQLGIRLPVLSQPPRVELSVVTLPLQLILWPSDHHVTLWSHVRLTNHILDSTLQVPPVSCCDCLFLSRFGGSQKGVGGGEEEALVPVSS